jgi:transposase-like protein
MEQGSLEKAELRKMAGMIEADETYIGGLEKNKHKDKKLNAGRGAVGKSAVMGLLERGTSENFSRVRVKHIKKADRDTLHGQIKENVEPDSLIMTDAHPAYRGLQPDYAHAFVDHAIRYVEGCVHTNGLENFWALTKRCIKGTYVHIDPVHLDKYLDEEVFRFNNRGTTDYGRFKLAGASIVGKRLTYEELTHGHLTLLER